MKVVLALLCVIGIIVSVNATCSLTACLIGSPITGSEACKTYNDYIACQNKEKDGCTSSVGDQATLVVIKAAIEAATAARAALGTDCSAAGGITGSVFSLLLPVMMTFFKP